MTPDQTKQLLAKMALVDARTVDLTTIRAWHEVVHGLEYQDALEALTEHRRQSTDYVQPAHIIQGARTVRARRAAERTRQASIEAAATHTTPAQDLTYDGILKHSKTAAFRAAFDAGRVEGNAERAYWTAIRECKTHREAQAVAQTVRNEAQVTS